jgi:hypothetical protein
MSMRIYKLEGGGGAKGVVVAVLVVGAGLVIVTFGLMLLLALGAAAAVVGSGVLLYRRLTGRSPLGVPASARSTRPDRGLEVFVDDAVVTDRPVRQLPESTPSD